MNRQDLITELSDKTKMTGAAAGRFLNAFVDIISKALSEGDKVQIIGFGTFEARERAAKTGHNPKTGETVRISAKTVPAFKAGKGLKDVVNK